MCAKAQGLSLWGKEYAGKRSAWSGAEFLNSTLLAFGAGSVWAGGGVHPMHWRVFSSTPKLCPLGASSNALTTV